jgi:hypothetical protein
VTEEAGDWWGRPAAQPGGGPLSAAAAAVKVETVANDSRLHLSTSALAAGSTISLKWRKKSTPMLGKETAANKKSKEIVFLEKTNQKSFHPSKGWVDLPPLSVWDLKELQQRYEERLSSWCQYSKENACWTAGRQCGPISHGRRRWGVPGGLVFQVQEATHFVALSAKIQWIRWSQLGGGHSRGGGGCRWRLGCAPGAYLNAEINTENIHKYLQQQNSGKFTNSSSFSKNQADIRNLGAFQKIRRIWKILALLQKSGGFEKYWRFYKNQADSRNIGAFRKSDGFEKYWHLTEKQVDLQNVGVSQKQRQTIESWRSLKSPRLVKNQRNLKKLAARLLFRLGVIFNCWLPPGLAEELSFRSL